MMFLFHFYGIQLNHLIGAALVADVEASQQQYLSRATLDACNQAFAEVVKLYGYRPDVYTMGSWVNSKMSNAGWIASYPYDPTGKTWYSNNNAWQYQSTAHFQGSYGLVVINYEANYGVNAYISKGQELKGTNLRFKVGSRWQSNNKLTDIPKVGFCYQVSTDEFIPVKYQQASGFQG